MFLVLLLFFSTWKYFTSYSGGVFFLVYGQLLVFRVFLLWWWSFVFLFLFLFLSAAVHVCLWFRISLLKMIAQRVPKWVSTMVSKMVMVAIWVPKWVPKLLFQLR